jgi:CheY-specific phosphatase CheX
VTSGDLPSLWTFAGKASGSTVISVKSDTAVKIVPVMVTAAP